MLSKAARFVAVTVIAITMTAVSGEGDKKHDVEQLTQRVDTIEAAVRAIEGVLQADEDAGVRDGVAEQEVATLRRKLFDAQRLLNAAETQGTLAEPLREDCAEGEYLSDGHCCKEGYTTGTAEWIDYTGAHSEKTGWERIGFWKQPNIPGEYWDGTQCSSCQEGKEYNATEESGYESCKRCKGDGSHECTSCFPYHGLLVNTTSNHGGTCLDMRRKDLADCIESCRSKAGGRAKPSDQGTVCSRVCQYTSPIIKALNEYKTCDSYGSGGSIKGSYNAPGSIIGGGTNCKFDNVSFAQRFNSSSAGQQTAHESGKYKYSAAQCGFNKIVDCDTDSAGDTSCSVTKTITCNAIQPQGSYGTPTKAEVEACTYAPHACTFIAETL